MTVAIAGQIDLARAMREAAEAVEGELDRLLGSAEGAEARLVEAMRYALLGGGKRLRPFLLLSAASLFGVARRSALRAAAAIEMIHTYSLVHDDLPAMDDDDLRRGRPTVHVRYDEATAILVGDALQALAFEVLADDETHSDPVVRCDLVRLLAHASGAHGMVGGQMIDLEAEHEAFDLGAITRLQNLKTGALIAFSCEAGAVLGKASPSHRHALKAFAHDLGLAFQIADDLLDAEGDAATVGKRTGKDKDRGKATFVSLLGIDQARRQARLLADQAIQHLEPFDERAEALRAVSHFVVDRKN